MLDPEGVSYDVNSSVWYDDGHSVDGSGTPIWVSGTVAGFPSVPGNTAAITPVGGGASVGVKLTDVHVGKPNHPPDRG